MSLYAVICVRPGPLLSQLANIIKSNNILSILPNKITAYHRHRSYSENDRLKNRSCLNKPEKESVSSAFWPSHVLRSKCITCMDIIKLRETSPNLKHTNFGSPSRTPLPGGVIAGLFVPARSPRSFLCCRGYSSESAACLICSRRINILEIYKRNVSKPYKLFHSCSSLDRS